MLGILGVGHQGQKFIRTCEKLKIPISWTANEPRFDADCLIIATPAETHYELSKQALRMGRHVIIEKPMVMDRAEAEDLYDLARQKNVSGFVDHTHLYSPAWREIKSKVGAVKSIQSKSGGPCKAAPLWDWGSHDIAMRLDLVGDKPVNHVIYLHKERVKREFRIEADNGVFIYDDPKTDPQPLEVLMTEFMDSLNNPNQDGIRMGLEVCKVLCG